MTVIRVPFKTDEADILALAQRLRYQTIELLNDIGILLQVSRKSQEAFVVRSGFPANAFWISGEPRMYVLDALCS